MCLNNYKSDLIYFQNLGTDVHVTLLDANQFKFMVSLLPSRQYSHTLWANHSCVFCYCKKPFNVVRWNRVTDSFQRFSPDVCHVAFCKNIYVTFFIYLFFSLMQDCASYLAKAAVKKVVMLPLILFADDTSGNKSKKWHKIESWYLLLAGLPRHLRSKVENIHFLCITDCMSALDMASPIVDELILLERSGLEV